MTNITTHRFDYFGLSWHVEIDQDEQELVKVECNGEPVEFGVDDYIAIPKKSDTGGYYDVQHITDALYDMAQEVGSE